jgi:hypothetical protein
MATGAATMLVGDAMAQGIELHQNRIEKFDSIRSCVMVSWAMLGDVPINIAMLSLVDGGLGRLGIPARANIPLSIFKGLAFFIPGSAIRNPCFMAYCTTVEHAAYNITSGRSPLHDWEACAAKVPEKMQQDLVTIWMSSAQLWIPINSAIFYAVPTEFRVVVQSCAAMVWLTYLSIVQHKDIKPASDEDVRPKSP